MTSTDLVLSIPLIAGIILVFYWILKAIRLNNHDRVLYQYCELRRKILWYLDEDYLKLSDDEYKMTVELLRKVNGIIHHFNQVKVEVFNFRTIKEALKLVVSSDITIKDYVDGIENRDIKKFHYLYRYCLIYSFYNFVPFFTSRISLWLWSDMTNKWFEESRDWIKQPEHQYNVYAKFAV